MMITSALIQNIGWMELLACLVVPGIVALIVVQTMRRSDKRVGSGPGGGAAGDLRTGGLEQATALAGSNVRGEASLDRSLEQALERLLAAGDADGFAIAEARHWSGRGERPFVQFLHSGDRAKGLIIDLPTMNMTEAQKGIAERAFARMKGWHAGDIHQAFAGLHAPTAARIGRELLAEVYGIEVGAELEVKQG
jgi:hypothetical protein